MKVRLGKLLVSHFKTFAILLAVVSTARAFGYASEPVAPWPGDNPPGKALGATQITPDPTRKISSASTTDEQAKDDTTAAETAADQFQQNPIQKFLDMMVGGEQGMAGNANIGDFGGNRFSDQKFEAMNQIMGSGKMEQCGAQTPPQVKAAFDEAIAYRASCGAAQRGTQQKIAINDYSSQSNPPSMYIFDLQGNCLGKTAVTYGNGAGRVKPQPCHINGSHLTPAGFHLTAYHDGGKYGANNALGLVGLEGQNSVGRGVIIHPAKSPGTASSWGCSGVGFDAFNAVKSTLGFGSLVYNYFGNTGAPNRCPGTPGLTGHHNRCQMDGGSRVPASSTAGGTPNLYDSGTAK
jgi:hypothetical protein